MHRTVIVGLDGIPYGLIKKLTDNNTLPNIKSIISSGTFNKMASSIPHISSVAWSSVITGANPGEHGIFGFTDLAPNSYRMIFPSYNDLKVKPFWENKKAVIINVPSTYPARPLNGTMISGFVALDLKKATYPSNLIHKLNAMDYQVDVDSSRAHMSLDLFLKDLDRTLKARISTYRFLWHEDWEIFMLVFTGTDRLSHFLWEAYEDENHKYHANFIDHLQQIDEVIGEIAGKIKEDDTLVILSDHGFEKSECDVQINFLLLQQHFLKFDKVPTDSLWDISPDTKAFALDPARIYINMEGKYPKGSVKDRESVIRELVYLFSSFETDKGEPIKRIYRKEEVYSGAYLDYAPDLILLENKGFDLKASLKATQVVNEPTFSGKHSQDDAFLIVNKKVSLDNISVSDVVATITQKGCSV